MAIISFTPLIYFWFVLQSCTVSKLISPFRIRYIHIILINDCTLVKTKYISDMLINT